MIKGRNSSNRTLLKIIPFYPPKLLFQQSKTREKAPMTDVLTSLYNFLSNIAGTNQLLFVFLVSLFGNIIPVIPIPYLIIVITIVTTFPQVGIVQVAAVSALGAASGKFVSYGLGYGVREAMAGSRARFDSLRRLLGGSVFLVAFIFAATPLPDDVAYIPMGIMKYSPIKTYISLYTGKFVLTLFVLYTARKSEEVINGSWWKHRGIRSFDRDNHWIVLSDDEGRLGTRVGPNPATWFPEATPKERLEAINW